MDDKQQHEMVRRAERIKLLERIHINFPDLKRISETISYCHQHSKVAAEPECLLITGQTGAGKTTLCRLYAHQYPRRREKESVIAPVLLASIPVPATAKSLATRLLEALGDPMAARGTTVNQTQRVARLIKECGVELVILDEFQHFIDSESNHILLTVANWLKDLLNETNIPMILVGLPYSDIILQANAQLARRFTMREALEPFKWESAAQQSEFKTFLHYLDGLLPLEKRSQLASEEIAFRIYCATAGVIGFVMKLIRRAGFLAISRGSDNIDLDLLAQIYQERFSAGREDNLNPFRTDLARLRDELAKQEEFTRATYQPTSKRRNNGLTDILNRRRAGVC